MMGRKTKPAVEEMPLMMDSQVKSPRTMYWDGHIPEEDLPELDDPEWLQSVVNSKKRPNGTLFLATDSLILVIQYIQLFCLIQSLSLHWPWPEEWLQYAKYLFLLNADVWEFMKLYADGIFRYTVNFYVPSAQMPADYAYIMSAWAGFLIILSLIGVSCYSAFNRVLAPKTLFRLATLKKVAVVLIQILLIPIGTFLFRLFHCNPDGNVDVKNELICYRGIHWAYLASALVVLILLFVVFPSWLIIRAKEELLNAKHEKHEIHLQLVETEYIYGINISWMVGNYYIFASFKKSAVHFRAAHVVLLAVILIIYAALLQHLFAQALVMNCILFIILVALCFLRPYRVTAFNVLLIINYLCLNLNCLTGSFKTSFNSSNESPWLLPEYQFIILATVNGFWLLSVIIFVFYVIVKTCCCQNRQQPIWPQTKFERLSPETRKYMKHIIIGRLLTEKMLSVPAMFAPIQQVTRYIHIINAYCREAELIKDPLRSALWDVLNELIEIHTNIAPKCLFAESTKDSIRNTAADLMTIMPSFVRRLAQREYDFILVNPVKRRILLKLYCLSHFLRHIKIGQERRQLTVPATQKIWQKQSDDDSDPGYFEDMYPPKEPLVLDRVYEKCDDVLIQFEDNESDSSFIIEDTENWLKKHGLSSAISDDHPSAEICSTEEQPESSIPDRILLKNFIIPGLTYREDSILDERKTENGQNTNTRDNASVRTTSSLSHASLMRTPRSGSRQSTNMPVNSRQNSHSQISLGSRPTSATPVDLLSVDESLPGAVTSEEDVKASKLSADEAANVILQPDSSKDEFIGPGTSQHGSSSSLNRPSSSSSQKASGLAEDTKEVNSTQNNLSAPTSAAESTAQEAASLNSEDEDILV